MDYDVDMDDAMSYTDDNARALGKRPHEQGSSEDSDTNNQLDTSQETPGENRVRWLISVHVSPFTIVSSAGPRVVQSSARSYRVHAKDPTEITSQG
jgi:hypothetical protein